MIIASVFDVRRHGKRAMHTNINQSHLIVNVGE